eukprot:9086525-Karenia_brevis.AAC.1
MVEGLDSAIGECIRSDYSEHLIRQTENLRRASEESNSSNMFAILRSISKPCDSSVCPMMLKEDGTRA